LHVLPTLWFRNTWSWGGNAVRPGLRQAVVDEGTRLTTALHPDLGERFFYAEGSPELLFTENETNNERLVQIPNRTPYVKDGINNYIVHGRRDAVNPEHVGTKVSPHYSLAIDGGKSQTIRLRLSDVAPSAAKSKSGYPFNEFEALMKVRRQEADE